MVQHATEWKGVGNPCWIASPLYGSTLVRKPAPCGPVRVCAVGTRPGRLLLEKIVESAASILKVP